MLKHLKRRTLQWIPTALLIASAAMVVYIIAHTTHNALGALAVLGILVIAAIVNRPRR